MSTSAQRGHHSGMVLLLGCWMMVLSLLTGCNNGDDNGVSGNPALSSLTLSAGALVPSFDPNTTSYSVDAGFLAASITVTAEPAEAGATVTVNGLPLGAAVLTGPIGGPVSLAEGSNTLTILVSTPGGASKTYTISVTRESAASFAEQAYLKASNTGTDDDFGVSVALSGDTLAVGAAFESSSATGVNTGDPADNSKLDSGAVYVFTRNGTTWSQQAYIKASNTDASDRFGLSVALSGDTLAVGAFLEDSKATGVNTGNQDDNSTDAAGAVYVFTRSGTTWTQQAYIKASNADIEDGFGISVALSGDTLAVGAWGESSNATGVNTGNQDDNSAFFSGAVYVFTRSGTTWTQQAYIKASNTEADDDFGVSVALSGDTLVVGADGEDSNATDQADNSKDSSGAVYVFTRSGSAWTQQAYLKASNTDASDFFGYSVALSGDTLAVGAYGEDSDATNQNDNSADGSGAVYVFTRSGSAWSQQAYLKASNSEAGDEFGASVALSGDALAVGATGEDSNATGVTAGNQADNSADGSGAVYLFTRSGSAWSQQAYLKASNTDASDLFGLSAALSGDTLAVGAGREDSGDATNQNDNSAADSGAVYAFQ